MTRLDDEVHNHLTWGPILRPEWVEDRRLHRHRIHDPYSVPRFTSWDHNGPNHAHRLPDGAWSRPRMSLRPPLEDPSGAPRPIQAIPPIQPIGKITETVSIGTRVGPRPKKDAAPRRRTRSRKPALE